MLSRLAHQKSLRHHPTFSAIRMGQSNPPKRGHTLRSVRPHLQNWVLQSEGARAEIALVHVYFLGYVESASF